MPRSANCLNCKYYVGCSNKKSLKPLTNKCKLWKPDEYKILRTEMSQPGAKQ